LESELLAAGFTGVSVDIVDAPVRLSDAKEFTRFARESFGALHQMMSGLDPDAQAAIWEEVETAMAAFEGPDGFVGPCELLVGCGTAG
jgi:hypothetical protein